MSSSSNDGACLVDDAVDSGVERNGVLYQEDIVRSSLARKVLAGLRILVGFMFLWPFLDKLFGLGFGTPGERAWVNGGKPAQGFLSRVEGPFAGVFKAISSPAADVLFMLGLLAIGVAVLLGAGLKIAAISGSLLMFFMWLAQFPTGRPNAGFNNPLVDDHWVLALALILFAVTLAGDTWGVGKTWAKTARNGWLR